MVKNIINKIIKQNIKTKEFYRIFKMMIILEKLGLETDGKKLIEKHLSEENLEINNLVDDLYYCQRRELVNYIVDKNDINYIDMYINDNEIILEIENDRENMIFVINLDKGGNAYKIKELKDKLNNTYKTKEQNDNKEKEGK